MLLVLAKVPLKTFYLFILVVKSKKLYIFTVQAIHKDIAMILT